MIKIFIIPCLLIVLCACHRIPIHKTEQYLIEMELNRSRAIAAHDTTALDKMYASEFKGVTATGFEVDKQVLMQVFKRDNPDVIFTNENHKVQIVDKKTAILTGSLTGKDKTGKLFHRSLYIHVLIWRDKRWQILRGQGTMLPLDK